MAEEQGLAPDQEASGRRGRAAGRVGAPMPEMRGSVTHCPPPPLLRQEMSGRRRHWLLDCAFLPAYERFKCPRVPRNGASTGRGRKQPVGSVWRGAAPPARRTSGHCLLTLCGPATTFSSVLGPELKISVLGTGPAEWRCPSHGGHGSLTGTTASRSRWHIESPRQRSFPAAHCAK